MDPRWRSRPCPFALWPLQCPSGEFFFFFKVLLLLICPHGDTSCRSNVSLCPIILFWRPINSVWPEHKPPHIIPSGAERLPGQCLSAPAEKADASTAPDSSLTAVTEQVCRLHNKSASSPAVTSLRKNEEETLLQELVPLSAQQWNHSIRITWRTVYVTVVRRRWKAAVWLNDLIVRHTSSLPNIMVCFREIDPQLSCTKLRFPAYQLQQNCQMHSLCYWSFEINNDEGHGLCVSWSFCRNLWAIKYLCRY